MRSRFDRPRLSAADLGLSADSTVVDAAIAIAGAHQSVWPRFGDDDLLDEALGLLDRAQDAIEGYTDPCLHMSSEDAAATRFERIEDALAYYEARADVVAALIA